ncbi:MAG: oxygen-independent coproporphyrinogen III oxidase [Gammaproteobacteria bacterium]|nr:MAG: oxygen-independent coproporphyrinogen III oxidase [Gammaproteobacteria bacterium]
MEHTAQFDLDLIKRYDTAGPRYTSYPTALEFNDQFNKTSYLEQVELSNKRGGPLSLYFHLPFCDTVCFYCGCNKIITKNRKHAEPYLANLHKEVALQAALFDSSRQVDQLHWGGGTPTFISHDQMRELMAVTHQHFNLADDDNGEFSIEIDPREADAETIKVLREIGFNRISLGVQDFNPIVQKAVNRIQSEEETFVVIDEARKQGFRSVSIDLIYGLPFQTPTSFAETLTKIINVSPDRISVFNYAHMPERFKVQRQMNSEDIPLATVKLAILQQTIEQLTAAGYVYIGMDHFAKPSDDLTIAQQENRLHRNFQGYSTHSECDLIGLGITSIGRIADSYSQNQRTLAEYAESLDKNELPLLRGLTLNADDKIRRAVITELICHFYLDTRAIEQTLNIDFYDYFADVIPRLKQFSTDGLLTYNQNNISVLPAGYLLIRNICMAFDRYSQQKVTPHFSKLI